MEQPVSQPTPDTSSVSEAGLEALDKILSEEREPEAPASAEEPTDTTESTEQSPVTAEEEAVLEALNLAEFDPGQAVKFGDDVVTLKELQEFWNVRKSPEVIKQREAELQQRMAEIEKQKEQHSYLADFDTPHKFLHSALTKMVESEVLPLPVAQNLIESFNAAIAEGHYDLNSVEARAAQIAREREIEAQRQEIEAERQRIAYEKEIALVTAKYGEITPELNQKAYEWIESEYQRTGKLPTISEAFAQLDIQGAFKKAPTSKPKLADALRREGTVVNEKAGRKQTVDDALRALQNVDF